MGERKVLNRYVPPDFDPSIIPKFKRDRSKLAEVRMMLPFSLRCNTCSEYMYRGKKFNSKKETVMDDDYMGIRKVRFYIKCSVCSAEITFKTDPKNADYECESGASRNFELWRDTQQALEEDAKDREEEEQDAMKALEHKTMDNKMEMDVLDALDEIKAINQRHRRVDTDKVLEVIVNKQTSTVSSSSSNVGGLTEEDEALIKSIKFGQARHQATAVNSEQIANDVDNQSTALHDDVHTTVSSSDFSIASKLQKEIISSFKPNVSTAPTVVIKKKRKVSETTSSTEEHSRNGQSKAIRAEDSDTKVAEPSVGSEGALPKDSEDQEDSGTSGGLGGLLMDYGGDSD